MNEQRPLTLDDDSEFALAIIRTRIEREPDNLKAKAGLALLWLSDENLKEGWPQFKWQLKTSLKVHYDDFPVPPWDGSDLSGKHVLVWLDAGVGDQIFEAGMLPDLLAVAASVTLLCTRRLVSLFRRSFPALTVYRVGEPVPPRLKNWAFDCQMSVADMGQAFRPSMDFKARPYIEADPAKVAQFRSRYGEKRLVGLSWWTRNTLTGAGKSMRLADLTPILTWPDTTFVNLQYGDNQAEIAQIRETLGVEIIDDKSFNALTDIDTFAAQVAAMDAVVTSSNTTAHVAGALGVPGVVMLPQGLGRYWYWHRDRSDSPWYPSLTLVRQASTGDWESVTTRVAAMGDRFTKRPTSAAAEHEAPDPRDARIAALEDALAEFAVFAQAAEVPMEAEFPAHADPKLIAAFKRDTRYCDMSMFYRAAELTRGFR